MSCTTMNMFAPRIWGFDLGSPEACIARLAGWSRADLLWEDLMERGNAAWVQGDARRAATLFRRAYWVVRLAFARDDLRRATGLVNLGIVAREAGREARARTCLHRAGVLWDACAERAIAGMRIAPRARSSLFHLRMEALHRETYHDNFRTRITRIANEVRAAIRNLEAGQPPECRLYARWLGERPPVHDDTRKVLGACLLIVDMRGRPSSPEGESKEFA